ncbi:aldehyde dehydrogenase (NADP(+)) [Pinibacter aurantiacus]|nr:aldehyde dehydrogenase (NADP(+)) [Pinibacter aurantiacus]
MAGNFTTDMIAPSTQVDIAEVMERSGKAFADYKKLSPQKRADFLLAIAAHIEDAREELILLAQEETNLPQGRLNNEITRTTTQLKMFASLLQEGSWVEATIDTDIDGSVPAKPDTRKILLPTGPVIVFGASNFPFAFSTAGGDTASALAAGCPVVVKGHSAHAQTSLRVFKAIEAAIAQVQVPAYTVQHVMGPGSAVGKQLVMHPAAKGVGFTGSYNGGTALVEYARQRSIPIPVFAEMSSINPVVFYPDTLAKNATNLATTFAASITLGMGQFCTNPGLLIGIEGSAFEGFLELLAAAIKEVLPQKMLHTSIHTAYETGLKKILSLEGIRELGRSCKEAAVLEGTPVVAMVQAKDFLANEHFTEEVFGPFSLAVSCRDKEELQQVLKSLKGQLTSTIVATPEDIRAFEDVIELQHNLAGRIILNNAPTGVEVCASMVHGGPFPATTDERFTSVGTSAIKRWVRPVCFQNFLDEMLPAALQNSNPLGILRLVNNQYTRDAIVKVPSP